MTRRVSLFGIILMAGTACAAPMLRLSNSVVTAMVAAPGLNAASSTLYAHNAGDGTLSLTATVDPPAAWVTVQISGLTQSCTNTAASCYPIIFSYAAQSLAAGTYTARVTIADPNAVDSPQVVIVTLQVGGVPIIDYIAPGTTAAVQIGGYCFFGCAQGTAGTTDGGNWLSLVVEPFGTLSYEAAMFAPAPGMALGKYTGTITLTTETIPVTMYVTPPPVTVAYPSQTQLNLRLAENSPPMTYPFLAPISLQGQPATGVTASGAGASAYLYQGQAIVAVDPGNLAPGLYSGSITLQCAASNCPIQIPVNLEIIPQGPPVATYQGVVDNATFQPSGSPGDVMIVRGEQLSLQPPQYASGAPLPTTLGGASVLVNGVATPLYYSSYGQIAFEVRNATTLGAALVQVFRDGQYGNTVSVPINQFAPGIVAITDTSYNIINPNHPATAGQTIVLWALGLGPTIPPVPEGVASPANPPAIAANQFTIDFGSTISTPSFIGLSPGSVGLYQIIVNLPTSVARQTVYGFLVDPSGNASAQTFSIPVQ